MASSKSLEMAPNTSNVGSIFIKSQRAKPVKLPKDTNLSGQTAIVTGASTGLGFHCCRHLLSFQLSHLIMPVRSVKRGEDAASKLRAEFPRVKIEVWTLEMSSYESIQAFVRRVEKDLPRLDIAILNAGLTNEHFEIVESTGHEEVIQVNYLSTVLLSILLLPALKTKSPPSTPGRLTIVNSGTSYFAKFPNRHEISLLKSFDDKSTWNANEQYPCSKLLLHYFMVKLINYVDSKDVIVNCVDPGLVKGTSLSRDVKVALSVVYSVVKSLIGRLLDAGSSTYVDAAVVKGKESHGCFVMDWKIAPFALLLYAPDSYTVREQLWHETMKELEFASPLRILESMKQEIGAGLELWEYWLGPVVFEFPL
ncbi:related to short-chain dehydrogenase/reductase family protein, putative [Phialocephala subalpina]|uniref:Related to short-chain dehydrogenase/reductase family protein, putative n=1 Tax=Phialocephala subalpina TaxID=576137 RepID=A0A1L7X4L3_9HELO|nr:related to short-chain dehydrogenase/reductase family protein, putative [Phialocephala subalpina]